jgi:hypothetical protein
MSSSFRKRKDPDIDGIALAFELNTGLVYDDEKETSPLRDTYTPQPRHTRTSKRRHFHPKRVARHAPLPKTFQPSRRPENMYFVIVHFRKRNKDISLQLWPFRSKREPGVTRKSRSRVWTKNTYSGHPRTVIFRQWRFLTSWSRSKRVRTAIEKYCASFYLMTVLTRLSKEQPYYRRTVL